MIYFMEKSKAETEREERIREKGRCFLFLMNFYWSVVDLQCWVSFGCTAE